jgi:ubiquinone/menaquinone biosynthesis C-methylase UbiE
MLRHEKAGVRDFYDSFGWGTDEAGTYNDTASFVDLRSVLSHYYHDTQLRVRRFLKPSGTYFLDAGSGPLSQPEYLSYSAGYTHRVCIDLSARALKEARRKLGAHGLYVIGDLGHLPFRDGTFDGVLASHVLYHVPADEQADVVHELYRTLKSGGRCVIIYMWPTSLLTKLGELFSRARDLFGRLRTTMRLGNNRESGCRALDDSAAKVPPLYCHPHDLGWMTRTLPRHWNTDIRVWRSVDFAVTRAFIDENFAGRLLLRTIYRLEEMFPHALARWGKYPCIVIEKSEV